MLVVMYPIGIMISKNRNKTIHLRGWDHLGQLDFSYCRQLTDAIQIPEYLIVASVGMAMLMAASQNLLVLSVKPQEMGLQTAMNTVFRNVGSSLGAPIAGSILSTFTFVVTFGGVSSAFPTETASNTLSTSRQSHSSSHSSLLCLRTKSSVRKRRLKW